MNCTGAMGKGLARHFKPAFPEILAPYKQACAGGELVPGRVQVLDCGAEKCPQWIVNLPTKRHWRSASSLDDVEAGVIALAEALRQHGIPSVAVPALGCGLGGLPWEQVHAVLLTHLEPLRDVDVVLFPPQD